MLIAMRKIMFWRKLFYHSSSVLHILAKECYQYVMAVANLYNIKPYQVLNLNNFGIQNSFWLYFSCLTDNSND